LTEQLTDNIVQFEPSNHQTIKPSNLLKTAESTKWTVPTSDKNLLYRAL